MLSLPENLMLIALKDKKGTVLFTAAGILPFSIIGAVIMELHFAGKIDYENHKLVVRDAKPAKTPYFDEILQLINTASGKKDIKHWLLKANTKIKNIKERALEHLVESKVLGIEKQKVLGLFSTTHYPTIDPEPERELREQIRSFVLNREVPDEKSIALLSLVHITKLLEDLFSQEELKEAKSRMNEILERSHEGTAIPIETSMFLKALTSAIAEASGTAGVI